MGTHASKRVCLNDLFICFTPVAQVEHVDKSGQCALVHAALRGHTDIIRFLLEQPWAPADPQEPTGPRTKALQQALIAASSMGHTPVSYSAYYNVIE